MTHHSVLDLFPDPYVPAEPAIDAVYLNVAAAGMPMFERAIAGVVEAGIPNPPVDIADWLKNNVRLPYPISERSGPLILRRRRRDQPLPP